MAKGITQRQRAWILWEAGIRSPGSMERRGKIPESAEVHHGIQRWRDMGQTKLLSQEEANVCG